MKGKIEKQFNHNTAKVRIKEEKAWFYPAELVELNVVQWGILCLIFEIWLI